MKKEKKFSLQSLLSGSLIYSTLDKLAALIYKKAENGFFGSIMTAFGREDSAMHSGLFARIADKLGASKQIKHKIARGCEQSAILGFFDSMIHRLGSAPVRYYGVFFAVFGGISLALGVSGADLSDMELIPYISLVCSGVLLLWGVVMLFSGKSMVSTLQNNRFTSFILFSVMGVRRGAFEQEEPVRGNLLVSVVAGILMGLASHLVPTLYLVIALIVLIGAYTVLILPEFGVVASIFCLCFLPTMVLVAMMAYTFLCYMLKLWRGKRTFRFTILDGAVTAFFIFMVGGGIASAGGGASLFPALVYLCFMLGYFLAVNLIRSEMWVKRCVISVVLSSALVSLYGVYQNFFEVADTRWQDTEMFEDIEGRVVSTFENPNVLGEYLVMILPLLLALFIISKGKAGKFAYFALGCLSAACLVFTWSRGAWLGIIFALGIFFVVYTRKTMIACLACVPFIPLLPFVLPETIVSRFTSIGDMADSSTSYRVSIWEAAVDMVADYPVSGIGIGNGAFSQVYPMYSLGGIESAPHAHNLFLQTAVEIGIPGMLMLIAVIFLFAQSCFSFYKQCKAGGIRDGMVLNLVMFAGLMGVLLQGLTDYIWYNYRVYLMFWLMLGLTEAIRRVALEVEGKELPKENNQEVRS